MKKQYLLIKILLLTFMVPVLISDAWAASYDIKEMTPEVKSALDSRRARNEQLRSLKAQGAVGENNTGYVQALKPSADTESLVVAENHDRHVIYKTIVAQNELPADALSTVEKVFAQVQRDKAAAGDPIQDESGNWVTK